MRKFAVILLVVTCVNTQKYLKDVTITQEEKEILDKFSLAMTPYLTEDFMREEIYLIRWLRAAHFDLENAKKRLMKNLKWRKDTRIREALSEDWSDIYEEFEYSIKGRSKQGQPQLYIKTGAWDMRRAALTVGTERFLRYVNKIYEEAREIVYDLGMSQKNVSQSISIFNADGFNAVQHGCLNCIAMVLRIISEYELHFPGATEKIFVINAPAISEPLIRASRGALHPITNKAFLVYGTNKRDWWPRLLEEFTVDQIPEEIGGTLNIDD